MLMQNEYVLAFEVAQAFITPETVVALCYFDVGNECGEVLDPGIVSAAFVLVGVIWTSLVPIEKIDRDCMWFVRDVDRVSCFPSLSQKKKRLEQSLR